MKLFVVRNRDGDIIDKDGYDPIENADDIPFAEFLNYFYEEKEEALQYGKIRSSINLTTCRKCFSLIL